MRGGPLLRADAMLPFEVLRTREPDRELERDLLGLDVDETGRRACSAAVLDKDVLVLDFVTALRPTVECTERA